MTEIIRLRRHLSEADPAPIWPAGIHLSPLSAIDPAAIHTLLAHAYANGYGSVPPLDEWWPAIISDEEYDPDLVFVAVRAGGEPIGVALCWASGFVKDLAVRADWRGYGIGEALLHSAFNAFRGRGLAYADLKVMAGNAHAITLYKRLGMVEVAL